MAITIHRNDFDEVVINYIKNLQNVRCFIQKFDNGEDNTLAVEKDLTILSNANLKNSDNSQKYIELSRSKFNFTEVKDRDNNIVNNKLLISATQLFTTPHDVDRIIFITTDKKATGELVFSFSHDRISGQSYVLTVEYTVTKTETIT